MRARTKPNLSTATRPRGPGEAEVERETAAWVHWYTTARLQSALCYLPSIEYEQHHHERATATTAELSVA